MFEVPEISSLEFTLHSSQYEQKKYGWKITAKVHIWVNKPTGAMSLLGQNLMVRHVKKNPFYIVPYCYDLKRD